MAAAAAGSGVLASLATPGAFRQLGKPKGAAYWLLRVAISMLLEDPENQDPDNILGSKYSPYPLFSRLSLSHKLALMAELAEGLLCPGAPLPPDTLQHHAALLYVFENLQEKLDVELDLLAEGMEDDEEPVEPFRQAGQAAGQEPAGSDEDEEEGDLSGETEDLGDLSEDDSAELAAALRRGAEAAAAAEAAAGEQAAQGGGEQQGRAAPHASNEIFDESFMRQLTRETAVRQRKEKHGRRRAARVAAGMADFTEEQLVQEVIRGPNHGLAGPQDIRVIYTLLRPLVEPRRGVDRSEVMLSVWQDSSDQRKLRQRLGNAEDLELSTGNVTWRSLLCAYLRQRYPQLTQLDPNNPDANTYKMFTSLKYGLGPCLILSDAERALQYGMYDDTDSEPHAVARTLLIDRFVQRATRDFQASWTPDQDVLCARLLPITCPAAGWLTLPDSRPARYNYLLDIAATVKRKRQQYIEAQLKAADDVAAWKKREAELKLWLRQLESRCWMVDWHKAVRRLPGSYHSLTARIQAVKLVHPRHPSAACVTGRPRWMGSDTPLNALAKRRQEERARWCTYGECSRQEAEGEEYMCCARCKVAAYCSPECQLADWRRHKLDCEKYAEEWRASQ